MTPSSSLSRGGPGLCPTGFSPACGPLIVRGTPTYIPGVLASTTSNTYAPGAFGLEGFESTHPWLVAIWGVYINFLILG